MNRSTAIMLAAMLLGAPPGPSTRLESDPVRAPILFSYSPRPLLDPSSRTGDNALVPRAWLSGHQPIASANDVTPEGRHHGLKNLFRLAHYIGQWETTYWPLAPFAFPTGTAIPFHFPEARGFHSANADIPSIPAARGELKIRKITPWHKDPIRWYREMVPVWELTYRTYREKGYVAEKPNRRGGRPPLLRHYPLFDFLPQTSVIGVYCDGKLIGTVSITRDGPFGLTTDAEFGAITDRFRGRAPWLARLKRMAVKHGILLDMQEIEAMERDMHTDPGSKKPIMADIWRLATDFEHRTDARLLNLLMLKGIDVARENSDFVFLAVTPTHGRIYKKKFSSLSILATSEQVNGLANADAVFLGAPVQSPTRPRAQTRPSEAPPLTLLRAA